MLFLIIMQESKFIHMILWLSTFRKKLTLYDVIILIRSVFNKDQNHYFYDIFLEKCLYQLAKKQ